RNIPERSRALHDVYHTSFTLRGCDYLDTYLKKDKTKLSQKISCYFSKFLNSKAEIFYSNISKFHRNLIDTHGIAEYAYMFSQFSTLVDNEKQIKDKLSENIIRQFKYDHFLYRRNNKLKIDAYFPRWSEAPMIKALCYLIN